MPNQENEKKKFRRVVLIDDNRASNFLHQCLVEELALSDEVIVFQNGQQALQYWTNPGNQYLPGSGKDLVLLDVNMPIMNGWELLDELEKNHSDYLCQNTVVMLTTCLQDSDTAHARNQITRGVLEKPLDEEKVFALLDTLSGC
jgi:CheY-like chemotaxis protein